ncbi:hypothetical protein OHA48_29640 [Streptomyces sp. NBC_00114]
MRRTRVMLAASRGAEGDLGTALDIGRATEFQAGTGAVEEVGR